MCLVTNNSKPKIATKDIMVYKVLKCQDYEDYLTPWQNRTIKLDSTFIADGEKEIIPVNNNFEIEGGFIHAYINKEKAIDIAASFSSMDVYQSHRRYVVVKCIVLKGTEYFISKDGYEICSTVLKIGKTPLEWYNI